ncbi:unnamed protein product [Dovyalis caffra]|uniref:Uncharacterized protein n=1 Tax=Dovyalis caffra TaxID=77055 RepID=A0AAV1S8R6_9ROSI|nr:unnamed protein product [Dovyalis caffra]
MSKQQQTKSCLLEGAFGNIVCCATVFGNAEMDIGLHELTNILSEAIAKLDVGYLKSLQGEEGIQGISKSVEMQEEMLSEDQLDRLSITSWTNIGGVDDVSLGYLEPVWIGALGQLVLR